MFKKIKTNFTYNFSIKESNLYSIEIEAACASGKIFGLWGGEDLRVEIDGKSFRESPERKRAEYFNIPPAWNGAFLDGKIKTVFFILRLEQGNHELKFIPRHGAIIASEPIIKIIDSSGVIIENKQAEEGNRRSWITIALINLPLNILYVSATCAVRKRDSDDLKVVIDGKIEKNQESGWWGRNRYDENIIKWTNYWNEEFLNDKFPVQVPLDPSLVKAIIYQESKMGYFPGGDIDIMQVGNEGDPALKN